VSSKLLGVFHIGSDPVAIPALLSGRLTAWSTAPFLHKGALHCANFPHQLTRSRDGTEVLLCTVRPDAFATVSLYVERRERRAVAPMNNQEDHELA